VRPFSVVLLNEFTDEISGLEHGPIVLEINLIMRQSPPETFSDDIFKGQAHTVHADPDIGFQENLGEARTDERSDLIGVEDFQCPINSKTFFHGFYAEKPVTAV